MTALGWRDNTRGYRADVVEIEEGQGAEIASGLLELAEETGVVLDDALGLAGGAGGEENEAGMALLPQRGVERVFGPAWEPAHRCRDVPLLLDQPLRLGDAQELVQRDGMTRQRITGIPVPVLRSDGTAQGGLAISCTKTGFDDVCLQGAIWRTVDGKHWKRARIVGLPLACPGRVPRVQSRPSGRHRHPDMIDDHRFPPFLGCADAVQTRLVRT